MQYYLLLCRSESNEDMPSLIYHPHWPCWCWMKPKTVDILLQDAFHNGTAFGHGYRSLEELKERLEEARVHLFKEADTYFDAAAEGSEIKFQVMKCTWNEDTQRVDYDELPLTTITSEIKPCSQNNTLNGLPERLN